MRPRAKINRRAFLRGTAGMTLALPVLEAMGKKVSETTHVVSVPCTLPTECHFRTPSTGLMNGAGFLVQKKMGSLSLVSRQKLSSLSVISSVFWADSITQMGRNLIRMFAPTCG